MKTHNVVTRIALAILAFTGFLTSVQSHAQWNPQPGWKDSYAVGGKCYCDSSNFDHGLDQKTAPTPVGELNVVEICNAIEARLGKGPTQGRIPYNDIQCGNGPANDAADERGCPGRVDIGSAGCNQIGPKWDLESVYGAWPGTPGGALDRSGWQISVSSNPAEARRAIDGQGNTRWTTLATQRSGQSFVLDLQSPRTFDRIVLDSAASPNDYPRGYEVYVSNNGSNWGSPIRTGRGSGPTTTLDVGSVTTRYLRIAQTGSSNRYWWSIHEINLVNNAAPAPRFISADTFVAGSGFQIQVVPNPLAGVASVALFVNDQSLRTERVTPYQWGGGNQADSARLRALSPGQHQLRALVTYNNGRTATATQQLTLTAGPQPTRTPTPTPTPPPGPSASFTSANTFDAGSAFEIVVVPNPVAGVATVELFVNDQSLRTERVTPYEWGGGRQADAPRLRGLAPGQHRLRALVTYTNGRTVTASQQLTLRGQATPTPVVTPTPVPPTPTPVPTPVSGARFVSPDTFVAGSIFQIQLEPDPLQGVESVELFVNEQSLRTERVHPYQWGGANTADRARLQSLPAGQHRLRAIVTYADGRKFPAMQEITLTRGQATPTPTAAPTRTPSPTRTPAPVMNAWSDPATWGGRVPTGGNVTIPAGRSVTLDMNVSLNGLTIDGELRCADQDLRLSAAMIMVHGRMDCGSEARPYTNNFTITLTGRKPGGIVNDGRGMGTKVIGVMNGGILNLHGEDRTSWLMLGETAQAGSRQLVLEGTTDWRAGDRLVVTSTSQNMREAEEVVIESINGRVVRLRSALRFRHFGEVQTFSNGSRTWNVDTRAEVGLLSRNIKIVGDGNSDAEGFGGHMMVMRNSEAYISGVQLDRMGQRGLLGRYPFHWHLAGDVSGQYIKNSAIYNSFNRCVTVHGSHNALVDDTVCFRHIGHGYFLEDGVETGNVFNHNLGVWTIKPSAADALIDSDRQSGLASRGPSTFWISNGDNTYTNNSAAGSEGLGFWYDTEDNVTGPSRNMPGGNINPRRSRFGGFSDNRIHSSDMALSVCSKGGGTPGYHPPNGSTFKNTTIFYGGNGSVWPCDGNHDFDNLMVLDSGTNFVHQASFVSARPATVRNSLFVANSRLAGNSPRARSAFGIYDFGVDASDTHVENYLESTQSAVFTEVGGAHTFMHQSMQRFTNRNTNYWLRLKDNNSATSGSVVRDLDNSLGYGRNMSLTADLPLMVDGSCQKLPGIDQARMCPGRFIEARLHLGANAPSIDLSRSDVSTRRPTDSGPHPFYKFYMPVNRNYMFEADFKNAFTSGGLRNRGGFAVATDFGVNGDVAKISLRNLKSSARVSSGGYSRVNSMAALNQANGNAWFKQGNTIHLRIVLTGNHPAWKARGRADIAF